MNKVLSSAVVVTSLVLTLSGASSWGAGPPPNVVTSDNAAGNTAGGTGALSSNSTGIESTAFGYKALWLNTKGSGNTASGASALQNNTEGVYNTASGDLALFYNTTGNSNTASGAFALGSNTTGAYNSALGYQALYKSKGSRNLALGLNAGFNLTSGDSNIYLGHTGFATESNTMRLGQVQSRTFISGIYSTPLSTGSPKAVYINSGGQAGILASSARYKRDIAEMGEHSQGLHQLRPVTFRYTQDPQRQRQYGLIAEEVVKVYPELVTQGANGKVESVQYHALIPMLLNEVQHQHQKLEAQSQQLSAQSQQLAELKAQNESLRAALAQQQATVAARLERLEEAAVRAATLATR